MIRSYATGRARLALAGLAFTALTILCALLAAGNATSADGSRVTIDRAMTVSDAVDASCSQNRDGAGVDTLRVSTPPLGDASFTEIEARLTGPSGSDWDLAILDADTGRVVAASAFRGASEVAGSYLLAQTDLLVQACRLSGSGDSAQLTLAMRNVKVNEEQRSSLVFVETPTRRDKENLQGLGLDLTEHGGPGFVAVVLHSAADRSALERVGLEYEVEVPDLGAQSVRQQAADRRFARATAGASALPSGRQTYRRLFHYTAEMKRLAKKFPNLVRPITLPRKTWEGRPVEGIEITTNARRVRDGKPVFLQMGAHHAREWPSSEHAMEWAHQLIKGYRRGNKRVRRLVRRVRTIVIPVVNPDGFEASREAGEALGHGNGQDGSFLTTFPAAPQEYRRKNCRLPDNSPQGNCAAQPGFGIQSTGVDPNRNYGAFWGGPGASDLNVDEDYRGPGPFSEPETKNIRWLVSHRQVTVLITNHTFSNLVLRPPGVASQPNPVDDKLFTALGNAMAAENGYLSQRGYELYDTTGTTEDWSYNATGGLGFTFEIYCDHVADPLDDRCGGNFHPTFSNVIDEYVGGPGSDAPAGGGGNRAAYFLAMAAAADPRKHSVLRGRAPAGAVITLTKRFRTPTMNEPAFIRDRLKTRMRVPRSGRFVYHVNPSTRPLVALARGRRRLGSPSPAQTFSGDPSGATPCGSAETTDPACFNEHPFKVRNGPGVDNDSVTVSVSWPSPASDWDLYVYRDGNADGDSLDAVDKVVADSAQGTTASESATFVRPEKGDGRLRPGSYVARVVNFAALEPYDGQIRFKGPGKFRPARRERWKLTCTVKGKPRLTRRVFVKRGQRVTLDLRRCGRRARGR